MIGAEPLHRHIARAVQSTDSLLEQLFFVASLRDAYTGRYLHEGWSNLASAGEIHAVMKDMHQSLFITVLRLPLLELCRQLRFHFRSIGEPERETCAMWLEMEPFRDLIPRACPPVLRQAFICQIRTALKVLCVSPDWAELTGPLISQQLLPDHPALTGWMN